jgi:hypothetical protein
VSTITPPRPKSLVWQVGDLVQLGSARWIIRTITGRDVELEASNAPSGIWWTTTLNNLPEKSA